MKVINSSLLFILVKASQKGIKLSNIILAIITKVARVLLVRFDLHSTSRIVKLLKFTFVFESRVSLGETRSERIKGCSSSIQIKVSGLRKSSSHLELEVFGLFSDVLNHVLGFKPILSVSSINVILHSFEFLQLFTVVVRRRRAIASVLSKTHNCSSDYRLDGRKRYGSTILAKLREISLITRRGISFFVSTSTSTKSTVRLLLVRSRRRCFFSSLLFTSLGVFFILILILQFIKLIMDFLFLFHIFLVTSGLVLLLAELCFIHLLLQLVSVIVFKSFLFVEFIFSNILKEVGRLHVKSLLSVR